MRTSTLLTTSFLALGLPFLASAGNQHSRSRRHDQLANRKRTDLAPNGTSKRDTMSGVRATYYDTSVGLGACGNYNAPSAWTIALDSAQFGSSYPSQYCGKTITISYQGKTAVANIQDECPTCDWGQIDLSQGLFTNFADTSVGVIYVDWWFNDGSSGGGNSGGGNSGGNGGGNQATTTQAAWTPDPTPTPTPTPDPPPPTTTWQAPTTTWTPPPPSSSTTSSSSVWSAPPSSSKEAAPSSSAGPVGVESVAPSAGVNDGPNQLAQLHLAFLSLGRVVTSGGAL